MRTIRTSKNRKRFLAAIADSGNITAACDAARLSRAAMYAWRADDPSFAAEWDAALERGLDSLEDELMRRAKEGTAGLSRRPTRWPHPRILGHPWDLHAQEPSPTCLRRPAIH